MNVLSHWYAVGSLVLCVTYLGWQGDSSAHAGDGEERSGVERLAIPPGYSREAIHLKFRDNSDLTVSTEGLSGALRSALTRKTK
ncbi:MAG TPA: hypothetical protein VFQ34_08930, partial [Nitrospiraceae bacterium]|nr:hypothetical protein [Nitrospiraceae bacterium]